MYYVYILKSLLTGNFYKGLTADLDRRLHEHISGKSPTTRTQLPIKLIHVETCQTKSDARKLEKYFKSGFGREIIAQIDAEVVER